MRGCSGGHLSGPALGWDRFFALAACSRRRFQAKAQASASSFAGLAWENRRCASSRSARAKESAASALACAAMTKMLPPIFSKQLPSQQIKKREMEVHQASTGVMVSDIYKYCYLVLQ